jgi:hypothetical protein
MYVCVNLTRGLRAYIVYVGASPPGHAKVSRVCLGIHWFPQFNFLRALAALDHADEIRADTSFIDIPLVISSFQE